MPCSDGGPSPGERARETREKIDNLTDMLCRLCERVGTPTLQRAADMGDIAEWWRHHQAVDRERARAETQRKVDRITELKERQRKAQDEIDRMGEA